MTEWKYSHKYVSKTKKYKHCFKHVVQRIFSALFCVIWSFSELLLLFSVTLSTNNDDIEENVCINQMEFQSNDFE